MVSEYSGRSQSRRATEELSRLLRNDPSSVVLEAVIADLKSLILNLEDYGGNGVPDSVREVRILALAAMKLAAQGRLNERFDRVAYVWTGSKNLRLKPVRAEIQVDGVGWYKGNAGCILLGNVSKLSAGLRCSNMRVPTTGSSSWVS